MKIEIIEDENQKERIIVYVHKKEKYIDKIIERIEGTLKRIDAYIENEHFLINQVDIESVYTEKGKVFVRTENKTYSLRNRLYTYEEGLSKDMFLRISNSEIINFDKVLKLDTDIIGTIKIIFKSGNVSYSSRRYIKKIKEFLSK